MLRIASFAIAIIGLLSLSVFAGGGPNGRNNHGLCTAYFAGSENGQAHKHRAGPFVALEDAAGCMTDSSGARSCDCDDPNGDGSPDTAGECVASFCDSATPGGK